MTTTQHTPGPWRAGPVFNKDGRAIFVTDKSKPGNWNRRIDDKTGVFTEYDARLIAAAPDLLRACMAVAGVYQDLDDGSIPLYAMRARAAIKQAIGE